MRTSDLSFHEAANIFPLLDENELDQLADDIARDGLQVPIQLCDGKIIDGRNRYLACLRRDPKLVRTIQVNPEDPVAYALSLNLHRRHMTEAQKAMVAAKARDIYEAKAKERQVRKPQSVVENLPPQNIGKARDQAGASVGVSGKSVDYATSVIKDGSKKLIEACERGQVAISAAARIAELPKKEQDAIIEVGKQTGNVKKAVAEAAKNVVAGKLSHSATYPATEMLERLTTPLAVINAAIQNKYGSVSQMFCHKDWDVRKEMTFVGLFREGAKKLERLATEFEKCRRENGR